MSRIKTSDVVETVVFLLISILVVLAVRHWVSIPVVHVSHSTKECVRVVSEDPEHSCKNLPEKYYHVWVK